MNYYRARRRLSDAEDEEVESEGPGARKRMHQILKRALANVFLEERFDLEQ